MVPGDGTGNKKNQTESCEYEWALTIKYLNSRICEVGRSNEKIISSAQKEKQLLSKHNHDNLKKIVSWKQGNISLCGVWVSILQITDN